MIKELTGKGFHILIKPVGPACNLDCRYCFYTGKKSLFPGKRDFRMTDEILEAFISKYISSQEIPEIQFVWQGGEPALAGIEFYRRILSLQRKHAGEKKIINALQTNGTLLNDEWCVFLKENGFLVGLSLDGPPDLHNFYRLDIKENPTFSRVLSGLSLLKKYDVPFNVLACVTRESSGRPLEIYRFLKEQGVRYIQFTPVVERNSASLVTDFSVEPETYGDFLIQIFEEWVRNDVGSTYVMNFEWALEAWLGLPSTICIFSKQCGRALAIEHNGDIYSCDHYVYPEYYIDNILKTDLTDIVESDKQKSFGNSKETSLPGECRNCEVKFACNGECPRHRFISTYDGKHGLNYLCAGYKKFFRHIHRYMKVIVQLIENGLPAANIKDIIKGPAVYTRVK